MPISPAVIDVRNLSKTFRTSGKALNQVTLRVEAGEMVALIGLQEIYGPNIAEFYDQPEPASKSVLNGAAMPTVAPELQAAP